MKRISLDDGYSLIVETSTLLKSKCTVSAGKFVAAIYDKKWYIGIVDSIVEETEDVLIKFMHPCGPAKSFNWPQKDDVCWIPHQHIVCAIEAPSLSSNRGSYSLTGNSVLLINQALKFF